MPRTARPALLTARLAVGVSHGARVSAWRQRTERTEWRTSKARTGGSAKPAPKKAAKKAAEARHQGPGGQRRLQRQGHHRPRGPRGGSPAPRDVHRLDRPARPPPPRLRGGGQLGGRGDRGPLRPGLGDPASRQQRHGRRRRPRDPGRGAREGEAPGGRGGDDDPARGRQVRRRRRLQGLRRPARGRGLGRQRALGAPPPRGAPRRPQVDPGLRARGPSGRAEARREGQGDGDDHHLPSRRRGVRGRRSSTTRRSRSGCGRRRS